MWANVARQLDADRGHLILELISLGAYYGRFSDKGESQRWQRTELARSGARKPYWECNVLERAAAAWQAKGQIAKLIRARQPAVVLLGNDIGMIESLIIARARSIGAQTLLVQDGILGSHLRPRSTFRTMMARGVRALFGLGRGQVYGSGGADLVAVMGKQARSLLVAGGVHEQRVNVTGQPRYDVFGPGSTAIDSAGRRLRLNLGIPANARVVAIFTQPMSRFRYMASAQWNVVLGEMLSLGGEPFDADAIVVKLHPADLLKEFKAIHGQMLRRRGIRVLQHEDLASILAACDVVVVHTSTVALEAMIFGKPVVMYSPADSVDPYGFVSMGAAIAARSPSELAAAVRMAFEDRGLGRRLAVGRRRAIAYHAGNLDGRAGARVAGIVLSMLHRKGG